MSNKVSVLMINAQGIMISVQGCDYFLSYNRIPWMQDAPIRSVLNVKMSGPEAIEWPDLDVDLEIDSLPFLVMAEVETGIKITKTRPDIASNLVFDFAVFPICVIGLNA